MTDSTFNQEIREKVFDNVVGTVERKLYDPGLNGVDWRGTAAAHRESIISAESREDFESRMNDMVRELHVSHAGFFSEKRPLAAAKIAIGATFHMGDLIGFSRTYIREGPPMPPVSNPATLWSPWAGQNRPRRRCRY